MQRQSVFNHFILKEKHDSGNKYYLYAGESFYGQNTEKGPANPEYKLIMMAKHFPQEKLMRLYAINDIDMKSQGALISSEFRIKKQNSDRVEKINHIEFDYSNQTALALIYINDSLGLDKTKNFVIKSRDCTECSKHARYYC